MLCSKCWFTKMHLSKDFCGKFDQGQQYILHKSPIYQWYCKDHMIWKTIISKDCIMIMIPVSPSVVNTSNIYKMVVCNNSWRARDRILFVTLLYFQMRVIFWWSKDKFISNVLLWAPSHGYKSVGWLTITYLPQLCTDTGCTLEVLPEAIDERDKWWERERERESVCVKEICACDTTW